MPIFLSVIIPAYNEALRIKETISNCSKYLIGHKIPHEIIVVDDGSTDKTCDLVNELANSIPDVKLVKQSHNQGKGRAVQKGMSVARGNTRLFMDADGSTPIEEMEHLLPYLRDYKVVIGSRALSGARIERFQPWYRQLLGKSGNLIIRILFGLQIYDTQCGFKLFTDQSADLLFPSLTLGRFGFDIELLALAKFHNLKIKEVPVTWEHKGESTVRPLDYFNVLASAFKIKIWIILGLYK